MTHYRKKKNQLIYTKQRKKLDTFPIKIPNNGFLGYTTKKDSFTTLDKNGLKLSLVLKCIPNSENLCITE